MYLYSGHPMSHKPNHIMSPESGHTLSYDPDLPVNPDPVNWVVRPSHLLHVHLTLSSDSSYIQNLTLLSY